MLDFKDSQIQKLCWIFVKILSVNAKNVSRRTQKLSILKAKRCCKVLQKGPKSLINTCFMFQNDKILFIGAVNTSLTYYPFTHFSLRFVGWKSLFLQVCILNSFVAHLWTLNLYKQEILFIIFLNFFFCVFLFTCMSSILGDSVATATNSPPTPPKRVASSSDFLAPYINI